jgi:2-methylcitrate dehydratase
VDAPKGDPRDPMTEEEIAVKFTALGGDVIGGNQCEKLRHLIMNLDSATKLNELLHLAIAR